jgi:hypothetical protein
VRRSRLLLVASWILTTMVATAVCAAGVSLVTRDVTESHPPALRSADVVALLAEPGPTSTAVASSATVVPTSALPGDDAATTSPPPSAPPPTAPPTSATDGATAPPTAPPPTEPPPSVDAVASTFRAAGGSVTARCTGERIELLSAMPLDGYRFVVASAGPAVVSVWFDGRDAKDEVSVGCRDGAPVRGRGLGHGGDRPEHDGRRDGDEDDDQGHENRDEEHGAGHGDDHGNGPRRPGRPG